MYGQVNRTIVAGGFSSLGGADVGWKKFMLDPTNVSCGDKLLSLSNFLKRLKSTGMEPLVG